MIIFLSTFFFKERHSTRQIDNNNACIKRNLWVNKYVCVCIWIQKMFWTVPTAIWPVPFLCIDSYVVIVVLYMMLFIIINPHFFWKEVMKLMGIVGIFADFYATETFPTSRVSKIPKLIKTLMTDWNLQKSTDKWATNT